MEFWHQHHCRGSLGCSGLYAGILGSNPGGDTFFFVLGNFFGLFLLKLVELQVI